MSAGIISNPLIQVWVGNSYSKITGLNPKQDKELRSLLSYTVGGSSAYFSKFGPRRKSLLSKRGEFPTGLLHRVYKYLGNTPRLNHVSDRPASRIKLPSTWNSIVPYEDQVSAVSAAMDKGRGIISMPTGSGKSLIIAMLINELKLRTLVVVPTLEIKKQLTEGLESIFTDMSNITVENIDSKRLKTAKNYDCLIIDEAHHAASKTYHNLNKTAWTGIFHRFFLTATPFRNDPEEELLFESIAGQIIYKLDYKDAVKRGYIVPIEAYYLDIPKQNTNAYTYAQVYSELVVKNFIRSTVIAGTLASLQDSKLPALCLVREVAHGKTISKLTAMPFVNGEDDESRDYIQQFNSGAITSLIGTTGVLGEGIDTKPCEYVIIAGLGKAKSQFMQQVGRAVRKYPGKESAKIILIRDTSHKFLLRHFNTQCKILKEEYGVECLKLGGL